MSPRLDEHPEQREEDGGLQQDRQAGRERVGAVLPVERHRLAAHRLTRRGVRLALVLLLDRLHLGREQLHAAGRLDLPEEQRDQQDPDHDHESDDRQRPRGTALGVESDRLEERVELDHDPGHDDHDRFEQTVEPAHRGELLGGSVCGRGHVEMAVDGSCWWNVVHATQVPGVAAQHPPDGEACPADGAVTLHRDHGVLRAGRVELARRRCHRRDEPLIALEQQEQQTAGRTHDSADHGRRVMG